jgi:hypothetical protein
VKKPKLEPVGLDTRADTLRTLASQGVEGIPVLEGLLEQEARLAELRPDLQQARRTGLLEETAGALRDVLRGIDAEAEAERGQVQRQIDAEAQAAAGSHLQTAAVVNLARLRETTDVAEIRTILDGARRAGAAAFAEAVAIVRPRLERMASGELGLPRTVAGSPTQARGAFALLCELPHLTALDAQRRLANVTHRHEQRKARVLDAAGRIAMELPLLIRRALTRPDVAEPAQDPTLVVGRFWQQHPEFINRR